MLYHVEGAEGAKSNEEHEPEWLRQEHYQLQEEQVIQQQQAMQQKREREKQEAQQTLHVKDAQPIAAVYAQPITTSDVCVRAHTRCRMGCSPRSRASNHRCLLAWVCLASCCAAQGGLPRNTDDNQEACHDNSTPLGAWRRRESRALALNAWRSKRHSLLTGEVAEARSEQTATQCNAGAKSEAKSIPHPEEVAVAILLASAAACTADTATSVQGSVLGLVEGAEYLLSGSLSKGGRVVSRGSWLLSSNQRDFNISMPAVSMTDLNCPEDCQPFQSDSSVKLHLVVYDQFVRRSAGKTHVDAEDHDQDDVQSTVGLLGAVQKLYPTYTQKMVPLSQFFIKRDEEARRPFAGSSSPGFAQPFPEAASGRLVAEASVSAMNASHVLCFHLQTTSGGSCGKGTLGYTHLGSDGACTCGDVLDVCGSPCCSAKNGCSAQNCSAGFGGFTPVLFVGGPTFIFTRTIHLPHFLQEVASAAKRLSQQTLSYFNTAVIDDTGGGCHTHGYYDAGSWAPHGSPIRESLQVLMMRTIAREVVFAWAIKPGKSMCVANPWREDAPLKEKRFFLEDPSTCERYRQRMMELVGLQATEDVTNSPWSRGVVLVLQRDSGGRVIRNLDDVSKLGLQAELNLTFHHLHLEDLTAEAQVCVRGRRRRRRRRRRG